MKRFPKMESSKRFLVLKDPSSVRRSTINLGSDGSSCCIECPDTPCAQIKLSDEGVERHFSICPTDSIRALPEGGITISNECISCGLCAALCPVAAIEVTANSKANVEPMRRELVEAIDNQNEFHNQRQKVLGNTEFSEETILVLSNQFAEQSSYLTQKSFYRLVASLFECLEIRTFLPPAGDTNNRIDLVLVDGTNSLAVEIKSATETKAINVKSVQQALENKIVLDQRKFFVTTTASSSLVVGYLYPPERSGVEDLITQIEKTFNIRIGLISIIELYRHVFRQSLSGITFNRSELVKLSGALK
jgi:Fe-S-cluster-containing hydrogenase component 2